ncbi:hypothetical protein LOTGIDRAFT_180041 [Lottia gigantea]|uniref:Sigma intracellular receptor 2 n=1 Tax=Lottia gigantea TaxID=225164 RepID=V4CP27_LOTGI|nr:hypothetical protein LOTGIDRAFT_180041 [Lottia gigantea]ESP04170.1 hypothetical protein LOTGIDRAFT_180041 [Lottia gigantea]
MKESFDVGTTAPRRPIEYLYMLYFITHIPITIILDTQPVLPRWIFPKPCVDLLKWYTKVTPDPLMGDPKPWFIAFCFCEITIQLPCFFIGVYVFYKGVEKNKWCRIPLMLYGCHTATTVWSIAFEILFADFSTYNNPGPETMSDRLVLLAIYSPYLLIPFLLVFDTVFSKIYQPNNSIANNKSKVQ